MRGSCLCGTITFELRNDLRTIYQCHCTLCRKQGGSSSNAGLILDAKDFAWTSGEDKVASYVRPTGFRSDFCSRCGSPVPNPLRATAYIWVPAGLLDDAPDLEVAAHIFVGSKASWEEIAAGGRRFDTMPELSEFIRLLHGG
jgi:hypothetical protein